MNGVGKALRVKNLDILMTSSHHKFHTISFKSSVSAELISIDTSGILMKRETGLNHFTISFDKYRFYQVNI